MQEGFLLQHLSTLRVLLRLSCGGEEIIVLTEMTLKLLQAEHQCLLQEISSNRQLLEREFKIKLISYRELVIVHHI